tara:strand:- start:2523 stop:3581 length:1059 start_codon:yes stop_codon:yes gene_type:complete
MNHDVIEDRYARLFELPNLLGKNENLSVSAVCLDYHLAKKAPISHDLRSTWRRYSLPRSLFTGWLFALMSHVRSFRPQCVIASSDCIHVIIGWLISRSFKARFFVDLYDDYSTFGLARVPGIRRLYDRALREADGICAVSRTLGRHMEEEYPGKKVLILESTIDSQLFYPRDKAESRALLQLNRFSGKKLVGVCGGLNVLHGADVVFSSFAKIAEQVPEVIFVIAGIPDKNCPLPELPNVAFLGALPHQHMPYFFSAMDVAIVALSNTRFGYFAFPQKAYEILACDVPVAAAHVGSLAMLFDAVPEALYEAQSPDSLSTTVIHQLQAKRINPVDIPTWEDQAVALANFITTP